MHSCPERLRPLAPDALPVLKSPCRQLWWSPHGCAGLVQRHGTCTQITVHRALVDVQLHKVTDRWYLFPSQWQFAAPSHAPH